MIRLLLLFLLLAVPAQAQDLGIGSLTEGLGQASGLAQRVVQILVLVTVLSLVPGIAMMVTCFPFIVTVLAILRQGIGLQQSPPNMLIVSIALFLTWFVMEPVFADAWANGVVPFNAGVLGVEEAFLRVMDPFRAFMLARMDGETFAELQALRPATAGVPADQAGLSVVIPAFMLSELQRAFEVGFLIFLPFLVIDLVVAAILMSMGMMMVPPAIVSLPFKLAFFVVADGWSLIAGALVQSYM